MTAAMPESVDPDLILRVRRKTLADGRSVLEFEAKARDPQLDLYFRLFDSEPFDQDPKAHFQELLNDIDHMTDDPGGWLAGRGIQLFEELVPIELQRRLWALRGEVQTVQILSDETWIPWELLKLQDPDDPSADGPFLTEVFSLTRWLLKVSSLVIHFPMQRIALVRPKDSGLPMGRAEGEQLKTLAGASHKIIEIPATLHEVKAALASGGYGGWHFTGHGLGWNGSPNRWSISLEAQEELSAPHLTGPVRRLGQGKPLIFLNACHTGRGAPSLTGMGGLASAFLKAGAGAFVGSLWSLEDEQAYCFAENFYRNLFSGTGMGEAARMARLALRERYPGSNNWLAYSIFAHPLAHCPKAPLRKVVVRTNKKEKKTKGSGSVVSIEPFIGPTVEESKRSQPPLAPPDPPPGAQRINEKDGTVLLYVPGGELSLGAKDLPSSSRPVRRVRLSPFWIGKFPVTNEQYSRFRQENAHYPEPAFWEDSRFNGPEHPVVGLSWEEAQAYCRWAGLELPCEAQWEAAARGTDERDYPWGRESPTPVHANFAGVCGGTTPVGAHPAGKGPYGTFDQAGNVWEWCADPWSPYFYQQIEDGRLDPVAWGDKAVRVLRGGSWNNPSQDLRSAYRDRGTAKLRLNTQGFRCVWRPA